MNLTTQSYEEQRKRWPASGRHILAQYDAETIWVYQAYRPEIGMWAMEHQRFGGPFSYNRMSWIKPNFLWMMYRCGWAAKPDQETVLAVRLKREGFDTILNQAVHSSYVADVYGTETAWKQQLADSDVRLQWDPDHDPNGNKQERRAIQLGLRGEVLKAYGTEWIVEIEDVTDFVQDQGSLLKKGRMDWLRTPREDVYPVLNSETSARLGVDLWQTAKDLEVRPDGTVELFRPVGLNELKLIHASGMTEFPPRLPEQPIFYPVLSLEYARIIARDWNTKDTASSGVGFVTRFLVDADFVSRYDVQIAGGRDLQELWVPAAELEEFNRHIVGEIEIVETYVGDHVQLELDPQTHLPVEWSRS